MMYRQGDFMFVRVEEMPEGGVTVKREGGRIIVGRGEATGHHHAVKERNVKMIEVDTHRYLIGTTPFAVTHEEHEPVMLPAGVYEIRQQRQYQRGEIRRVLD